MGVLKLGYMLEYPSIRRYSSPCGAVKMRPVRTISRKDRTQCSESSETNTPSAPLRVKIESELYGDMQSRAEMTRPLCFRRRGNRVQTVPRVFGGGALTTGTYAFPTDTASLEEFAIVATVQDSTDFHRFVFGRVNQTEAVEVQFNRANLAVLPFNFKVLAPSGGGSPGSYFTNA